MTCISPAIATTQPAPLRPVCESRSGAPRLRWRRPSRQGHRDPHQEANLRTAESYEEPRFAELLARTEARIAARGFRPRLLVAEPDPPDPGAPLLLGLHGATSVAEDYHPHWLPAAALGCIVASAQSTQPAREDTFCWDDREQTRRDLAVLLPQLPVHGDVVLTGFSQGAAAALDLALAGDIVRASEVIGVGPSYPPSTSFPAAERPLHVVILRGAEDPWGRSIPGTVEALRARWPPSSRR